MKQVTMTTDMRPFQANHSYTLPDSVAERLIGDGDAVAVAAAPGDVTFPADHPADAAPQQVKRPFRRPAHYLTREA